MKQREYNKKREYNKMYYQKNKEKLKLDCKNYYLKNKEKRVKHMKEYYKKNKEKLNKINKKRSKEWYKDNQKRKIKYQLNHLKNNSYVSEKTSKQRKLRYLKRRTRILYPLKNKKCKFCQEKATEHHHYTTPIKIDKFWFVCHKCHKIQNRNERRLK